MRKMARFRKTWICYCCATAAALLATMIALSAQADDDHRKRRSDHDIALGALMRGEIQPLEKIIAEVRKMVPGEFIDVELKRRSGLWIYKIKLITPGGALIKVYVNARTGNLNGGKGKPGQKGKAGQKGKEPGHAYSAGRR